MATANSKPLPAFQWKFIAGIMLVVAGIMLAEEVAKKDYAASARAEFERVHAAFQSDTNNATNAWQFARAAFDLAEFSTNDTQRAALARQGIAASRQSIAQDPKSAGGHYYLAMNLGQLARTEFLGALKMVREMEREFKKAGELDARFDYAGPERNLGLLYRDAPGWPVSIGNRGKSRAFSETAIKLAPDYPENHLNLIESYLEWGEPEPAKNELQALDLIWPVARTNLTAEKWESSWARWASRREAARKQLTKPAPSH